MDALTENDILEAVQRFLADRGYVIHQVRTTSQHGTDLVATSPNGKTCYVEAKGATSSKPGSARYDRQFTGSQARTHIAVAILKAFQLLQLHGGESTEVVIAIPNDRSHASIIASVSQPLRQSGVTVLFVNNDRSVEMLS